MRLQPPRLADIDSWQGAFISSTSRLLLPACEVTYEAVPGQPAVKVGRLVRAAAGVRGVRATTERPLTVGGRRGGGWLPPLAGVWDESHRGTAGGAGDGRGAAVQRAAGRVEELKWRRRGRVL